LALELIRDPSAAEPLAELLAKPGMTGHAHKDIQAAIEFGRAIEGLDGIVIVAGDRLGVWGNLQVVPLHGKKG